MPFGLQIVGPRGGDAFVLAVAAAIEEAFAGDAVLARPVPDLAALKAAPPISGMAGFSASTEPTSRGSSRGLASAPYGRPP